MLANRAQPDAIVLDLSMPGGSGVEVLTRIKQSARTKSIPVVVVTANGDAVVKERVISLGASEFLHKPVDLDELAVRLSNLLKSPNAAKKGAESCAAASLPAIPSSKGLSSKGPRKQSRSWRHILHEIATEKS
jgi:DNA-binding response OmpR family regulator